MRIVKNIRVAERYSLQFEFTTTNVFNHVVFFDGGLVPSTGSCVGGTTGCPVSSGLYPNAFGQTTSQGNNPRAMQFGLRFQF
jgi:hypothetical protein